MILRFYDATDGQVLIDNTDVRDLQLASLRRQMAMVTQEVHLFNDTVRANVVYGAPFPDDEVLMIEATQAALADEFITKLPNKGASPLLDPKALNLSSTGSNDYSGGGEVKNSQTIATRAAVQIIDVLPNGNLVFEGLRETTFSKERQFASLRGVVRAYDIQPDNTVLSSNIADARIEIISEGTLTDAQKKGWLLRLNDKINPF